jgi:hypothetical protein
MSSSGRLADTPSARSDQAGNWLAERYQLNATDRKRVRIAVERGEPVSDPRLNEAVRGLASEILDNRLRIPGTRLHYAVGAVSGVIGIVALAIALSPSGQHSGWETRLIALAVLAFLNVLIYFLWLPQQLRRKVAKALRVNSSDG